MLPMLSCARFRGGRSNQLPCRRAPPPPHRPVPARGAAATVAGCSLAAFAANLACFSASLAAVGLLGRCNLRSLLLGDPLFFGLCGIARRHLAADLRVDASHTADHDHRPVRLHRRRLDRHTLAARPPVRPFRDDLGFLDAEDRRFRRWDDGIVRALECLIAHPIRLIRRLKRRRRASKAGTRRSARRQHCRRQRWLKT